MLFTQRRDKIIEALADKDIETGIHYPKPPAFQKAYTAEPYNDKNKRKFKTSKKIFSNEFKFANWTSLIKKFVLHC